MIFLRLNFKIITHVWIEILIAIKCYSIPGERFWQARGILQGRASCSGISSDKQRSTRILRGKNLLFYYHNCEKIKKILYLSYYNNFFIFVLFLLLFILTSKTIVSFNEGLITNFKLKWTETQHVISSRIELIFILR